MNRPVSGLFRRSRRGFTLIEVLVAVTLTLIMMAAVVQIFAIVGHSINNSRSTLEMSERLRATVNRLRLDLEGATADMTPPERPEDGRGYFEYIEGPNTITAVNSDEVAGTPDTTVGDIDDILQFTTRSDAEPFVGRGFVLTSVVNTSSQIKDDIGFFETNTNYTPPQLIKSQVAEVAWFLRGTTLYRRVLLVSPSFDADLRTPNTKEAEVPFKIVYRDKTKYGSNASIMMGFYNNYDLSVHWDANAPRADGGTGKIVSNTLSDLTRRECRYSHPPLRLDGSDAFPYSLHLYNINWQKIGLPTLQECSHTCWPFPVNGLMPYNISGNEVIILSNRGQFDAWVSPFPYNEIDPTTGVINALADPPKSPEPPGGGPSGTPPMPSINDAPRYVGPRVAEDVILTNVLSFDVKAWDPDAPVVLNGNNALLPGDVGYSTALTHASLGAYVDLGYAGVAGLSYFSGMSSAGSGLSTLRVYDTWSTHYEHDGVHQNGANGADQGYDGFDNDGNGVVDDPDERDAPPPYDKPLRGIQVKVRVFEPDSRQVREVTIRHDFLKK